MSAVGFAVVGIFESLYEHEEEQGEDDTADGAHEAVQTVQGVTVGGGEGVAATQDAIKKDDKGCMVNEHGNQGDPF